MANSINQLITKLGSLDGKLKRSNDMAKAAGQAFRDELINNVNSKVSMVSDPAAGGANDPGRVLAPKVKGGVASVSWSGDQIQFLEFGTGVEAAGRYPDPSLMSEYNYQPRPDGHSEGMWWTLPEEYTTAEGEPVRTKGWVPYAPFYSTQFDARFGSLLKQPITDALTELIERNL